MADDAETAEAWHQLLSACRLGLAAPWPRFSDAVEFTDDGGLRIPFDDERDVSVPPAAVTAFERVRDDLAVVIQESMTHWDLNRELLMKAGRVLLSPGDSKGFTFVDLKEYFQQISRLAVCVLPLGGAYSSADKPLHLGAAAVVGHLSQDMEAAVANLARAHGLDGFTFNEQVWWTEDFLAAEQDGYLAAEIHEREQDEGRWPPLLLAVVVDAVGGAAAAAAVDAARAFVGALFLAASASGKEGWTGAPWVIGEPGIYSDSYSFQHGENGSPSPSPLQVDTLPGRSFRASVDSGERFVSDVDVAVLLEYPGVEQLLSMCASTVPDEDLIRDAVVAAANFGQAATTCAPEPALILLRTAYGRLLGALGETQHAPRGEPADSDPAVLAVRLASVVLRVARQRLRDEKLGSQGLDRGPR